MSFLYPMLTALSFALAVSAVIFWLTQRRTRVVLVQAIYFATEFLTFVLLTLTTGARPLLDIDGFRSWIVVARLLMLAAMIGYLYEYWRRIRRGQETN